MRRDVLEAAKALILGNRDRVNLGVDLIVDGKEYLVSSNHLGNLTSMRSSEAGLAAWICFAAAEDHTFEEGLSWEAAASYAADLSSLEESVLFAPFDLSADPVKEAVRRIDKLLALDPTPGFAELSDLQDKIQAALVAVRALEKLASSVPVPTTVNNQTAEAWISDAETALARAAIAVDHERRSAAHKKAPSPR